MEHYTLKEHLMRSYNVMILGLVYLLFGLASSYFINRFSPIATPETNKEMLVLEIAIEVAITVLFSYFIHVIIERLPLPMIGPIDLRLQIIREVRGGIVIAFAMFTLQIKLRNKIQYLFYSSLKDESLVSLNG